MEIHIDRLVVHGLERNDARDIGDAIRAQLMDVFGSGIERPAARTVEHVDAGIVRAIPKARSGAVAGAAARAIRSAVTAPSGRRR